MADSRFDLVVIGAGPGGYVAALRAAQLGMATACVEKEKLLGGTCLRIGCIPSKALLESSERYHSALHTLAPHGVRCGDVQLDLEAMHRRCTQIVERLGQGVDGLLRKAGVQRFRGTARLAAPGRVVVTSGDGKSTALESTHVLCATGSKSATLRGAELDGEFIGTSTEALSYSSVPGHLVVIGAGAIGLELGSVWKRLGARVTVLEFLDRIVPGFDAEIAAAARKSLEKQGLEFRLGTKVTGARRQGSRCRVECEGAEPLECDRVLVAVGRVPCTEDLGLEDVGVETDSRGRIRVDERFCTTVPGIHAIGDVIAGPMLAHKAEEEGIACVEILATGHGSVHYDAIPNVVYTHPEIASVGKTEEELDAAGVPFRKGTFPFLASGRALCLGETEGLVKVLAHAHTDRVLGVHLFGPRAGDLVAEAAAAMTFGASSEDIARTCHAHPTLAEALKEAALAVDGRALHR